MKLCLVLIISVLHLPKIFFRGTLSLNGVFAETPDTVRIRMR